MEELRLSQTGHISEENAIKVGKLLSAKFLVLGSYQMSGESVRINARLIDVEKGQAVESCRVDGNFKNIFPLQDDLSLKRVAHIARRDMWEGDIKGKVECVFIYNETNIQNDGYMKITIFDLRLMAPTYSLRTMWATSFPALKCGVSSWTRNGDTYSALRRNYVSPFSLSNF